MTRCLLIRSAIGEYLDLAKVVVAVCRSSRPTQGQCILIGSAYFFVGWAMRIHPLHLHLHLCSVTEMCLYLSLNPAVSQQCSSTLQIWFLRSFPNHYNLCLLLGSDLSRIVTDPCKNHNGKIINNLYVFFDELFIDMDRLILIWILPR